MDVPQKQEDSNPLISNLFNVLRRRWLPATIVFVSIFGLTAYLLSRQKPIYEASGELIFKTDKAARLTGIGNEAEQPGTFGPESSRLQTEAQVLRSGTVADRAIKSLGLPLVRKDILAGFKVDAVPGSDVLRVSYKSHNSQEAAAVVNELMKSYIYNDSLANRADSVMAREFIDSQLPQVAKDLAKSELTLRNFKETNRVTSLQSESAASLAAIADLERRITDGKAQLSNLEASSTDLRNRLGISSNRAALLSKLNSSDSVKQALTEHQKVEGQLAILRTQYQPNHPAIKKLQRQQETLQSLLQTRIAEVVGSDTSILLSDLQLGGLELSIVSDLVKSETNVSGLRQQLATLTSALDEYNNRLRAIPKLEQQQQTLERTVAVNRTTYESLLKRMQEVRLTENQKVGNARILTLAVVPTEPISPRLAIILTAGGVLGLLLALITVIALESMDTSMRTTDEVKRLFGYTLLGVLPNFGKKWSDSPAVFVRANPRSPISEAYRILQTNLRFLGLTHPIKSIIVTSSIPEEGKSTVAANLAATAAQLGKRTLLVDADMRRPSQQSVWNVANGLGLAELLTGQATGERAIQTVMPNLSLLLTGASPSNPLSLLDSKQMPALIQEWAQAYDCVIIDAPPLLAVADALVLGNLVDGLLFVAWPEKLNSGDALRAKMLLEQSGINVLGMVANGATPDDKGYYKYHNYYADQEEPSSTPLVGYASYKQSDIK
jgi:polysaccharide biosynthesis transport protein